MPGATMMFLGWAQCATQVQMLNTDSLADVAPLPAHVGPAAQAQPPLTLTVPLRRDMPTAGPPIPLAAPQLRMRRPRCMAVC